MVRGWILTRLASINFFFFPEEKFADVGGIGGSGAGAQAATPLVTVSRGPMERHVTEPCVTVSGVAETLETERDGVCFRCWPCQSHRRGFVNRNG